MGGVQKTQGFSLLSLEISELRVFMFVQRERERERERESETVTEKIKGVNMKGRSLLKPHWELVEECKIIMQLKLTNCTVFP